MWIERMAFYPHKKNTRLGGVEPPHMPPEGIALSTELQTYKPIYIPAIPILVSNRTLYYPSTNFKKCKEFRTSSSLIQVKC